MPDLVRDRTFEVGGVGFGDGFPMEIDADGFTPGQGAWRTQDVPHPQGDGAIPGRDYIDAGVWAFNLWTNGYSEAEALAIAAELRNVWPREEIRDTPFALEALRYRLGGHTRRIYGRARRWTPSGFHLAALTGKLLINADFEQMHPTFFDDVEQMVSVDQTPILAGQGLKSPLKSPVRTDYGSTPRQGGINVQGDRATWPVLEFQGGVNPTVRIVRVDANGVPLDTWSCRVLLSLNWDEVVTVDTRPWVRSSTLNGSFAPLSRSSRLQQMMLKPGRHLAYFSQDASLSPASVRVRWRNAHSSI